MVPTIDIILYLPAVALVLKVVDGRAVRNEDGEMADFSPSSARPPGVGPVPTGRCLKQGSSGAYE